MVIVIAIAISSHGCRGFGPRSCCRSQAVRRYSSCRRDRQAGHSHAMSQARDDSACKAQAVIQKVRRVLFLNLPDASSLACKVMVTYKQEEWRDRPWPRLILTICATTMPGIMSRTQSFSHELPQDNELRQQLRSSLQILSEPAQKAHGHEGC